MEQVLALPAGCGRRLLLWLQAVAPALAQMGAPAPALCEALAADASLASFTIDFRTELQAMLAALVHGLPSPPEHTA